MIMWIDLTPNPSPRRRGGKVDGFIRMKKICVNLRDPTSPRLRRTGLRETTSQDMAFPVRPVFTPFVVVVGGKYFFPVPECLLFDQAYLRLKGR
jgi:hypothetical protein